MTATPVRLNRVAFATERQGDFHRLPIGRCSCGIWTRQQAGVFTGHTTIGVRRRLQWTRHSSRRVRLDRRFACGISKPEGGSQAHGHTVNGKADAYRRQASD